MLRPEMASTFLGRFPRPPPARYQQSPGHQVAQDAVAEAEAARQKDGDVVR